MRRQLGSLGMPPRSFGAIRGKKFFESRPCQRGCRRARWKEKRDPCKICPCHFEFYVMKHQLGTLGRPPRSFGAIREKKNFGSRPCQRGCRRARWRKKMRSLQNLPVPFPILCYGTSIGDPRNSSKKFRSNPRKKNFWVPTMSTVVSAGCPWGLAACHGRLAASPGRLAACHGRLAGCHGRQDPSWQAHGRLAACQDRSWHPSVPQVACQRARWGEKRDPCKIYSCHFQFYVMTIQLGTLGMPPRSFGAIR